MQTQVKQHILLGRIERLKGHIETVGASPGFQRELERAESELREVEQRKDETAGR
jgi:hypothetical protein